MPVWYSLIVSLKTREQGVDLYAPVATDFRVLVSVDAKCAVRSNCWDPIRLDVANMLSVLRCGVDHDSRSFV